MRVMVIGSGPIVIGQAAEFDYAGSQACQSLREDGHEVILVNSNPATIMTDREMSDALYIEPLTVEFLERIIARERPDALLPTLGGQTGLNLATQLHDEGILEKYGVRLLGTPLEAIKKAEDRETFRNLMREIKEPVPESWIITTPAQLEEIQSKVPYPCIVRPAYTLGGTGGGIANTPEELLDIGNKGLKLSMRSQIMVERSLLGWKEVEYEVMRDSKGNCITICNMENFDPMGVHTGDSIVVAPSQTLSDQEYQLLRSASLKIISSLGIEGGCNVQLAVSPHSFDYYVIEVNPRVSRSSALASKATGYPIARVSAKIAMGKTLDEIDNQVTGSTKACFEPALDYCVVKIPRWPFDKFGSGDRTLFTQMKATGEVMAIDRNFESAFAKAIRGLEVKQKDLHHAKFEAQSDEELAKSIKIPTDERLWAIAEGLRRGWGVAKVNNLCKVDPWFLNKMLGMVENGLPDTSENVYKMVDTCAGEFESQTPYYYSTAGTVSDHVEKGSTELGTVLVLGSGPIRIGQGIEFDYSCVHCVWSLRQMGYRAIIINNNPETVSTDFDTGDGLYFEPVTLPDVVKVYNHEKAIGIVVQFGGQTAINLAAGLAELGIPILGTSPTAIHRAEDREEFDALLESLSVERPTGKAVRSVDEAAEVAANVGYPVLVRPSFVLGGRAMEIVFNENHLRSFYSEAEDANPGQPVLVDKYLLGKEAEVDVISDGEDTLVPGVMEHIERAGVHSGDSMAVYPPVKITPEEQQEMVQVACRIAKKLGVKGLMNIQFVLQEGKVYVLEVNPRASRTVPYLSKVTGLPMVDLATRVMMGSKLKDLGYSSGLWILNKGEKLPLETWQPSACGVIAKPENVAAEIVDPILYAIKAPVFSFQKLRKVEPSLGPEMKSTGEILGVDNTYEAALYKALVASGIGFKGDGAVLLTVRDEDKEFAIRIGRRFAESGREILATNGTATALKEAGIPCATVKKISQGTPHILDAILSGQVCILINSPSSDVVAEQEAAQIRRACIETGIPCITTIDTAMALSKALPMFADPMQSTVKTLPEYFL